MNRGSIGGESVSDQRLALVPGAQVEDFDIESIVSLDETGFVYLAQDRVLLRPALIWEYFPPMAARRDDGTVVAAAPEVYAEGLAGFIAGARGLARFYDPGILRVFRIVQAHGTAYLVTEVVETDLVSVLDREQRLTANAVKTLAIHLLRTLRCLHQACALHLGLSPACIALRASGRPVLVDMGAAGRAASIPSARTGELAVCGYAPLEQATEDAPLGPWSDLYRLGCTLFHCMTGQRPPSSAKRLATIADGEPDPVAAPLEALQGTYDAQLLSAVRRMMQVDHRDRPQTVNDVLTVLDDVDQRRPSAPVTAHAGRPARAIEAAPPVAHWSDAAVLSEITARLAEYLGPIAEVLVRKLAGQVNGRQALIDCLADELGSEDERQAFRHSLR